ncbi:MAG TPA: hypothetical protein ENI87_00300 [bacterium]|nr:hypothetical protein [bacterium]
MRWGTAVRASWLPCLLLSSGCSTWFFSGIGARDEWIDRSRPVALLETTGGVEFAATTEYGILSLGRTAVSGPCRVHYFLGPTPLIETGELRAAGGLFTEAVIDLKTQLVRCLDRSLTADDDLQVMWTPDGQSVERVSVALATGEGLAGDLLRDPGVELPAGATLLCRGPRGDALFAGLIAGRATVHDGPAKGRYYVVAGPDRVRELLAVPRKWPIDLEPKYRSDDISVMKPVATPPPPATPKAPTAGEPGGN